MINKSTIVITFLGLLLLAVPLSTVSAPDPAWAETEALKAFEAQSNQWAYEATQHLVTQDQPLLRVLGTNFPAFVGVRPAGMTEQMAAAEYLAVRKQALEDGWSDPAVLVHIYARDCHGDEPVSWCDPAALQAQFQRVDPDNALGPLMPLVWPNKSLSEPDLTPETEALLVEASTKKHFDIYHGAGLFDAWLAMQRFRSVHPTPIWPQEVKAWFEQEGPEIWEGMELFLASSQLMILGPDFYTSWTALMNVCKQARERERNEAFEACQTIADILRYQSRTLIAQSIGKALYSASMPMENEPAKQQNEPSQPWYGRVDVQVSACITPKFTGFNLVQMPLDHWPQFLKDQQEAGEVVAMQRAAQREYALFPEQFAWDPADCDSIYDLDDEQREELGMKMEVLRRTRTREARESVDPLR